jgi:hypothetical protein
MKTGWVTARGVLLGLSFVGATAGSATARSPLVTRIVDQYAEATWEVPVAEAPGCVDRISVQLLRMKEIVWDRDAEPRLSVNVTGPDTKAIVERFGDGCAPEFILEAPWSTPETWGFGAKGDKTGDSTDKGGLKQPKNLGALTKGAHVGASGLLLTDNLSRSYEADVDLVWSGKGMERTRTPGCFVMPDEETRTCLKVTWKEVVRSQTLRGRVSGLHTGPFESAQLVYEAGEPTGDEGHFVRVIDSVEVLEKMGKKGACECPRRFE